MVTNLVFVTLCVSGFGFQIWELGALYFRRDVHTETLIHIPQDLEPPATSICFRYTDILDYDRIKKELNLSISRDTFLESQSALTIAQIFEYSPAVEHFFAECRMRSPDDYTIDAMIGAHCSQWFNVDKFYIQEYICYRVVPSALRTFPYRKSAFAIYYPNAIYMLSINQTAFPMPRIIRPVLHEARGYPDTSVAYSRWARMERDIEKNKTRNYIFDVTYIRIGVYRLPAPYPTDCVNYRFTSHHSNALRCDYDCVSANTTKEMGKVPFSGITEIAHNLKHVSQIDLRDEAFKLRLRAIIKMCAAKCRRLDCNETYTITKFYVDEDTHSVGIRFLINVPREPFLKIIIRPTLAFVEFLVYVLSSIGTWFGISMLSLNPSKCLSRIASSPRQNASGPILRGRTSRNHELIELRREMRDETTAQSELFSNRLAITTIQLARQAQELKNLKSQVARL